MSVPSGIGFRRKTGVPAPGPQVLDHELTAADDAGCTGHRVFLDPIERDGVGLVHALGRVEDQGNTRGRPHRDLAARGDIRLLPAVDKVPRLGEKGLQAPAVCEEMDPPGKVGTHGDQRAGLVRGRLKMHRAKIVRATEVPWRRRGDLPVVPPEPRHLVGKATVHRNDVGVGDRQKLPPPLHLTAAFAARIPEGPLRSGLGKVPMQPRPIPCRDRGDQGQDLAGRALPIDRWSMRARSPARGTEPDDSTWPPPVASGKVLARRQSGHMSPQAAANEE